MNVSMIGSLIFKEDKGQIKVYYFSPQLVELFEQSQQKKFDKAIALEILKTQRAFQTNFLAPEMLDLNANWSDVFREIYRGESMYSITFTPLSSSSRKWWEFWKAGNVSTSRMAQDKKLPRNITFYQYNMRSIPEELGRCSDRECPCAETPIPRGTGYLYISKEAVQFMKLKQEGKVPENVMPTFGLMPFLVCQEGAELRGIDMEVAAEDARRWWETGKVPLRPTPNMKA